MRRSSSLASEADSRSPNATTTTLPVVDEGRRGKGGSSSPQPRARSTSPLRPIKNVPQAAMYDYLYGWEEYLRRSKEREFSVIYKKAPPGEMPFRAGRSRQRPHRFLKPNTSPEEMGWRQLLGCSDPTKTPIENVQLLMGELATARLLKQQGPGSTGVSIAKAMRSAADDRDVRHGGGGQGDAISFGGSGMLQGSRTMPFGGTLDVSTPPLRPTFNLELLKRREVELFELSQVQENLVRLPRPAQRMGLVPLATRGGARTACF